MSGMLDDVLDEAFDEITERIREFEGKIDYEKSQWSLEKSRGSVDNGSQVMAQFEYEGSVDNESRIDAGSMIEKDISNSKKQQSYVQPLQTLNLALDQKDYVDNLVPASEKLNNSNVVRNSKDIDDFSNLFEEIKEKEKLFEQGYETLEQSVEEQTVFPELDITDLFERNVPEWFVSPEEGDCYEPKIGLIKKAEIYAKAMYGIAYEKLTDSKFIKDAIINGSLKGVIFSAFKWVVCVGVSACTILYGVTCGNENGPTLPKKESIVSKKKSNLPTSRPIYLGNPQIYKTMKGMPVKCFKTRQVDLKGKKISGAKEIMYCVPMRYDNKKNEYVPIKKP